MGCWLFVQKVLNIFLLERGCCWLLLNRFGFCHRFDLDFANSVLYFRLWLRFDLNFSNSTLNFRLRFRLSMNFYNSALYLSSLSHMHPFKILDNFGLLILHWDILSLFLCFLLSLLLYLFLCILHPGCLVFDNIELVSHCSDLFAKIVGLSCQLLCLVDELPLLLDCFLRLTDLALSLTYFIL